MLSAGGKALLPNDFLAGHKFEPVARNAVPGRIVKPQKLKNTARRYRKLRPPDSGKSDA